MKIKSEEERNKAINDLNSYIKGEKEFIVSCENKEAREAAISDLYQYAKNEKNDICKYENKEARDAALKALGSDTKNEIYNEFKEKLKLLIQNNTRVLFKRDKSVNYDEKRATLEVNKFIDSTNPNISTKIHEIEQEIDNLLPVKPPQIKPFQKIKRSKSCTDLSNKKLP